MPRKTAARSNKQYRSTLARNGQVWDYDVVLSARRTMAIVIQRDGRITIRAPHRTPAVVIQRWVEHKALWIARKHEELRQRFPPRPPPQYVDGETHLFLGQAFPLQLLPGQRGRGVLEAGNIRLPCPDTQPETVKARLWQWYRQQAHDIFAQRLEACWPAFAARGHQQPSLHIRNMKTLWGSLARRQKMTLNLNLIRAPEPLIDYVVVHELCHLEHHNHGPRFYALMGHLQPDWHRRKKALEQCLM